MNHLDWVISPGTGDSSADPIERLHHDLGITPPSTRLLHHQQLAALQASLGDEALQAALTDGADAPADKVIAAALGDDLP